MKYFDKIKVQDSASIKTTELMLKEKQLEFDKSKPFIYPNRDTIMRAE